MYLVLFVAKKNVKRVCTSQSYGAVWRSVPGITCVMCRCYYGSWMVLFMKYNALSIHVKLCRLVRWF